MDDHCRTRTARLRKAGLAGAILSGWCLGSLGGCAPPAAPGAEPAPAARGAPADPPTAAQHGAADPAAGALPTGAVQVGPELYQVPIGADADGCPIYRLYSPTRLVSQAIAYRSRAGGFTADRRAAACPGR
jgi:hypothetical protein